MNMIERGRAFVQRLKEIIARSIWDWRRCPHCGSTWTIKNGSYQRKPWTFDGRQEVRVQRHLCQRCHKSYAEESAWLVRGSWYAREVHRYAVDHWVHIRSSLRRTAEELRSWMGRQERWLWWRVGREGVAGREPCYLCASTVHRWLDKAGEKAQQGIKEQWAGVENSGQFGTDGLWVRLRGGGKRVLLVLVDTVSNVVWATVVAAGEESAASWQKLFERVKEAGLPWKDVNGLVADAAHTQRCGTRVALLPA